MVYSPEIKRRISPIKNAYLVLADGSVYEGKGFGACTKAQGEVVFNTGVTGYVESITDPSYRGQILCQAYPLIGNYGVAPSDFESDRPWLSGYVVSEACAEPSHAGSKQSLDSWLAASGVPGIEGVDTRELVKKLRVHGVMPGILIVSESAVNISKLRAEAGTVAPIGSRDLVNEVTTSDIRIYKPGARRRVALIDCGVKLGIVNSLLSRGVSVVRVPASTPASEILSFSPSAVVISNGPGDPKTVPATIATVKELLEQADLPMLGICLGHQLIALAAGGDTYKLKFGHRSQNQPCLEAGGKRCYITSQNHGFAVDPGSMPEGWTPWFVNANDGTNEGLRHVKRPVFSVQFHPEGRPGPTDTGFLFDLLLEAMK